MTRRGKRHSPEQIVKKLRDADAMLNAGQDLAAVLQALEVGEATYHSNSKPQPHMVGKLSSVLWTKSSPPFATGISDDGL